RDAFAGLHTMDKLMAGNGELAASAVAGVSEPGAVATGSSDPEEELVAEEAKLGIRKPARLRTTTIIGDTTHTNRSDVSANVPVPQPPFLGSRVVRDIPLSEVFAYINETALFKGQWQ